MMATRIALDVCIHVPVTDHERQIIEANRRMAELGCTRIDYRYLPNGLQRFLRWIERNGDTNDG